MRRASLAALLIALAAAPAAWAGGLGARANFVLHCSGCHGTSGEGTKVGGVPAFPGSVGPIAALDAGRSYMMHVPGVVSNNLGDAEIAAVMNYILDTWGEGAAAPFTAAEVTRRRAEPMVDVVAARRAVAETLEAAGTPIADYPWP